MKNNTAKTEIIVILLILAIAIGGFKLGITWDKYLYNNGICTECGSQMELFDIEEDGYYYKCSRCDYTIRLNFER